MGNFEEIIDQITGKPRAKDLVGSIAGANHSTLAQLPFASSGHTGFEPTVTKGNLTETTSSILTITGGSGAVIGAGTTIEIKKATGSQDGYLDSADWTTFNNKLSNIVEDTTPELGGLLDAKEYAIDNVGDITHDDTVASDWIFRNLDLDKFTRLFGNSGGVDTELVTLDFANKRVGIETPIPTAKLEITDATNANTFWTRTGGAQYILAAGLNFGFFGTKTNHENRVLVNDIPRLILDGNNLCFGTNLAGGVGSCLTNATLKFRIDGANNLVKIPYDNIKLTFGTGDDGEIFVDSNDDFIFRNITLDKFTRFFGNSGSVNTEIVTLDHANSWVGIEQPIPKRPLHIGSATDAALAASVAVFSNGLGSGNVGISVQNAVTTTEVFLFTGRISGSDYGIFGSIDAIDFLIQTNNLTRMTIAANGNVAIGGTFPVTPTELFEVIDANGIFSTEAGFATQKRLDLGPVMQGIRYNTSFTSPTAIQSGDTIGNFRFGGHDGTSEIANSGILRAVATENWAVGSHGCKYEFRTTNNGSSSGSTKMIIDHDGTIDLLGNTLVNVLSVASGATDLSLIANAGSNDISLTGDLELNTYSITGAWDGTFLGQLTGDTFYVSSLNGAAQGANPTVWYNTSTGEVSYDTSSLKYKNNIRDLTDTNWIYDLRPRLFDEKDGSRSNLIGLIAEEVELINPDIVFKKPEITEVNVERKVKGKTIIEKKKVKNLNNMQIEGIGYQMLIIPMLKEIQKLKHRIDILEGTA